MIPAMKLPRVNCFGNALRPTEMSPADNTVAPAVPTDLVGNDGATILDGRPVIRTAFDWISAVLSPMLKRSEP